MPDSDTAYIGISPCGCVTFAMVAGHETPRQERQSLRNVINSGRKIEVVTADEARKRLTFDCPHFSRIDDVDAELDRLMESL